MAEEPEDQEEQEGESAPPPPRPKPSVLRWLPVAVIFLVLQAGGAYYVIQNYLPYNPEEQPVLETEEGRVRVLPEGDEPEASVDLGQIVANPRTSKARLFVVTEVTLAVGPSGAASEIESADNIDRVRDQVIAALSYATPDQLRSREGREQIKENIKDRINSFIYEGQVMEVYFAQLFLQANSGYVEE